jgi:hydroxymethyl cephem carbamoyltransferase
MIRTPFRNTDGHNFFEKSASPSMLILSVHREHDASISIVDNGQLLACIEEQKDNGERYASLTASLSQRIIPLLPRSPDVIARGGWFGRDGGYYSHSELVAHSERSSGAAVPARAFRTSHLRAHIFCSYGLSPFQQGQPCYVLVWEGSIGAFYEIDSECRIRHLRTILREPGHRYAFLYELGHKLFPPTSRGQSFGVAGKLMALASTSALAPSQESRVLVDRILDNFDSRSSSKEDFGNCPFLNIGCEEPAFRELAFHFSNALFDYFYTSVRELTTRKQPLLICGGCGLNCGWNSKWHDSGLFSDVFIPPCVDDSGISVGVAVDAQRHFTGKAKLSWQVYAGEEFVNDADLSTEFHNEPLNAGRVAQLLCDGAVLAWVQGRYELGPRALGNRSLLAAPFQPSARDRLNQIKRRENYRPVAPICREEDAARWFSPCRPSPYMLFFQVVTDARLGAIAHVDGSARIQTVTARQNPVMYELLTSFERLTGVGVLCNTSLNFSGRGFINRMSDLRNFVLEKGIDGAVVGNSLYTPRALRIGSTLASELRRDSYE